MPLTVVQAQGWRRIESTGFLATRRSRRVAASSPFQSSNGALPQHHLGAHPHSRAPFIYSMPLRLVLRSYVHPDPIPSQQSALASETSILRSSQYDTSQGYDVKSPHRILSSAWIPWDPGLGLLFISPRCLRSSSERALQLTLPPPFRPLDPMFCPVACVGVF